MLTGFSSIVWYFVLANHTQGHHFFTYRIFAVSILSFLAIVLCSTSLSSKIVKASINKRLGVCVTLLVVVALSISLTFLAREELLAINGMEQFVQISMNDGDHFKVDFTPTFDEIRGLNLGLQSDGIQGYCTISLWDEEQLEYQETIFLENFDMNFQSIGAHWKLHGGKTYRLALEVTDTVQPVYIWVTDNGAMPLSEYGGLLVNDHAVEGQLLTGITYWALPASRRTLIFVAMTWLGILLASTYALWPLTKKSSLLMEQ